MDGGSGGGGAVLMECPVQEDGEHRQLLQHQGKRPLNTLNNKFTLC